MALIPYSVSPFRIDHNRGPNPRKYSLTFIPLSLAAVKCPSSWSMITAAMTAMTAMSLRKCPSTPAATTRASTPTRTSTERRCCSGVGGGGVTGASPGGL